MKFSVTVTLKKDVLDPQGKVVQNTLLNMGMANIKSIRQGKYFEIELNDTDEKKAKKKVTAHGETLETCDRRENKTEKTLVKDTFKK